MAAMATTLAAAAEAGEGGVRRHGAPVCMD